MIKDMKYFFIKPAKENYKIRDPRTMQPLDVDGESKPQSTYWLRRVAAKDVVIVEEIKTQSKSKKIEAEIKEDKEHIKTKKGL